MTVPEFIPVESLPHINGSFSDLYRDYISEFKSVQQFYQVDFHSLQQIASLADKRRSQVRDRSVLVEVLSDQNTVYGAGQRTFDNIGLLADEKTFAVVTGQQVGLFGGPLYTIYKAITAIKLAETLGAENPGLHFVPVFWLESEDHDFEEVGKASVLNAEGVPATVSYQLPTRDSGNRGAVGEIPLGNTIESVFGELQQIMGNSEFKQALFEMLRKFYRPASTFSTAFAGFLTALFQDKGLVFISPNDIRLKKLLSPLFQKEIREYPHVSQLIIRQSARLEEHYHAQIKTKALNLFYFHKGGRYFIEPRETDFSLRGTRHFIPKEDLLRVAVEQPELLSPNVALRPICQDMLLPTVAYVAGPSEVAYFAQLQDVYRYFDLTMPMIYPRATATITEERMEKILERYELTVEDVFSKPEEIQKKVLDMVAEVNVEEMFSRVRTSIGDQMNEMKFGINYVDPTLSAALEHTHQKIDSQITALQEKVVAAQQRKHETALRQIEKVKNSLFPHGNYQERELNVIQFMNKHGLEFVRFLYGELKIGNFQHQIIRI
ncbi:MAG TPA: bacillithiol biosynthesis cysteine-adding enzyme BshC [Bacteroidota bacterium]|nr:bacillithiol biosynthesis cysteine-adding enzyme BshC [Bacteroidota bacterium]